MGRLSKARKKNEKLSDALDRRTMQGRSPTPNAQTVKDLSDVGRRRFVREATERIPKPVAPDTYNKNYKEGTKMRLKPAPILIIFAPPLFYRMRDPSSLSMVRPTRRNIIELPSGVPVPLEVHAKIQFTCLTI